MIKEVDTLIQLLANKEYDNPKLSSKSMILISPKEFYPIMITYENSIESLKKLKITFAELDNEN